jgi:phosphoglycolate phosphatase-like HAD superfamily hydrolase
MEIKHKECFIPNIIKHWGLQAVSKYAREASEFVNLYSKWRGVNRWPALVITFDLLRERPEVLARHAAIPEAPSVRAFVDSAHPKSNDGLKAFMAEAGSDAELERGLAWTEAVNAAVADLVQHGVPPFPLVHESMASMHAKADLVVISGTPTSALEREWNEHSLAAYTRVIAGQEMGTKTQHLALATDRKYAPGHVLMIGDAPGDRKAAHANDALFYPINPGGEEASWERFYHEALPRFFAGEYAGAYEAALIAEFEARLPDVPPWQRKIP